MTYNLALDALNEEQHNKVMQALAEGLTEPIEEKIRRMSASGSFERFIEANKKVCDEFKEAVNHKENKLR